MRRIAAILAAILAAAGTLVWEMVNGTLRLVRRVMNPAVPQPAPEEAPVSEAEAIAAQIAQADEKARTPGRDGVTHRHPLGMALGMAARGYTEHLDGVADELASWVLSLSDDERARLVKASPDQIEKHVSGVAPIRGLPPALTPSEQRLLQSMSRAKELLAESEALCAETEDRIATATMSPRFA